MSAQPVSTQAKASSLPLLQAGGECRAGRAAGPASGRRQQGRARAPALNSWYASTMNSLHSSGQATPAPRMSARKLKLPWK